MNHSDIECTLRTVFGIALRRLRQRWRSIVAGC